MSRRSQTDTPPTIPTPTHDRLLRLADLQTRIPLHRCTIWVMVRDGRFPAPVKLGLRRLAWRESDIDRWIQERAEAAARRG